MLQHADRRWLTTRAGSGVVVTERLCHGGYVLVLARLNFVFTTRTGSPVEPRNFNRSFKRRCELAGVRVIRLHDTRHTCGSLLAALDVHPRIAMQILRHSKIAVTMEIYTHVPSEATRRALKKLGKHITSEPPEQPE